MTDNFQVEDESALMVDLDGVEALSFTPIPKGVYNAVFASMDFQISKTSGKPMWAVQLQIQDEPYTNRRLFSYISFSEKALPGTKATLSRVAPELLGGPFNVKEMAENQVLVGKACRVKVDIEQYQGNDNNRVKDILAPATGDDFFAS